jgi:hypothetical protein
LRFAHILWAALIARINVLCPVCGGLMRITPASVPPLWAEAYAQADEGLAPLPMRKTWS